MGQTNSTQQTGNPRWMNIVPRENEDEDEDLDFVLIGNKCPVCNTVLVLKKQTKFVTCGVCYELWVVEEGTIFVDVPEKTHQTGELSLSNCPICGKLHPH